VARFGPTRLADMEACGAVQTVGSELRIRIDPEWALPGEDRIGYTTIVRLVECLRELHWTRDVIPVIGGAAVDTITRRLELDFQGPVLVGSDVVGTYGVATVRNRSYVVTVLLEDRSRRTALVNGSLVSVFYDATAHAPVECPPPVRAALERSVSGDAPGRLR
jgi:acyl-CoA thioesterase FadM